MRVLARNARWSVHSTVAYDDCAAVRLSPLHTAARDATRTLLTPFDRITPLHRTVEHVVVRRSRWNREVLRLASASRPFGSISAAADASITLLPFQLEPALAMLRYGHTRILISDHVGMGKTIQAGLVLSELSSTHDDFRAIVLVPAGLRDQWRQELQDRFQLKTVVSDTSWLTKLTRELPADINPWSLGGIHIASFDLVKRPEVRRSLEDVTWDVAIVDEAHNCTRHTARLTGAHTVAARARRVLLITATPPDGDPAQLAALRGIGMLSGEPPLIEFRRSPQQVEGGPVAIRRSTMLHVRPSPAERWMHRCVERYTSLIWKEAGLRADEAARLVALVLRKRALSSATSLAASVRRRIELLDAAPTPRDTAIQLSLPLADEDPLEDAAPDGFIGAPGLADASHERALLHQLHRAAIAASRHESKVRSLLRFLRRAHERVIVFTEYRDTLEHLGRAVTCAGHSVAALHGGMSPRERLAAQSTFEDSASILLATDAASEGLNLHRRCRTVVHFELPWTISRLRQRTGRVDRFGQRRRVHEILLVANHTSERLVLAPLVRRARVARLPGAAADRLLETLTESAVAAAMMSRGPIAPPPQMESQSLNLDADAVEEVRRCDRMRRLGANRGPRRARLFVCRTRGTEEAFTLCVEGRLDDPTGNVVHSSFLPLLVRCRLRRVAASSAERRLVARELADGLREVWAAQARNALQDEMATAARLHREATAAIARRDAAILALRRPAIPLVQAGLFDSRWIQRRADQQTAVVWSEAIARRARDAARVRATFDIVAIR